MNALFAQHFTLPPDPLQAANLLLKYLLFSCAGHVEAISKMERIPGWFSVQSGCALYSSALLAPQEGEIVEIGSFMGRSTVVLASALKTLGSSAKVHAIDPHVGSEEHQSGGQFAQAMPDTGSTFEAFIKNLALHQVSEFVIPRRESSAQAASTWDRSPIRLLFIDGDHSVQGCEADFLAWEPFVVSGGLILLHDVGPHFPGPVHLVNKFLSDQSKYLNIFQVDSLHVAYKLPVRAS